MTYNYASQITHILEFILTIKGSVETMDFPAQMEILQVRSINLMHEVGSETSKTENLGNDIYTFTETPIMLEIMSVPCAVSHEILNNIAM